MAHVAGEIQFYDGPIGNFTDKFFGILFKKRGRVCGGFRFPRVEPVSGIKSGDGNQYDGKDSPRFFCAEYDSKPAPDLGLLQQVDCKYRENDCPQNDEDHKLNIKRISIFVV